MIIRNGVKLYTGQISIAIFSLFGLWRPQSWNTKWKIWLYETYSTLMITLYILFTFTLLMYLIKVSKNTDSFTESLYNFLAVFTILIKKINVIVKRKTIIYLREMFLDKLCQPRDLHELETLQKRSKNCRLIMFILLSLFFITALVAVFSPLLKKKNVTLPFSGWYPYSLESEGFFVSTYLFQSVCIIMAACTTASVEGLALAIIPQICTQLEIIFYRLHYLPNLLMKHRFNDEDCLKETMFVKDCVKHHMHIYALGEQLNNLFGVVIFVHFFTSMISLCALIYQLSRLSLQNPMFWLMLSSTGCVTLQNCLYCFYGEKLIQKSMAIADAVEQMNWITLSQQSKRVLLILMIRSSLPIKLTGSSIVVMSIKTFVKIMKSAYSAYNLLKNTY